MSLKINIFKYIALVAITAAFLSGLFVSAGPVLNDPETWDSGTAGWTNTTQDTTLSNPDGYLQITFDAQGGGPPSYEEDTIFTSATNHTGDFQTNETSELGVGLLFSFYASNSLPLSTVLYFHSTGEASTNYWQYSFDYTDTGSWTEYDIQFVYSGDWTWTGGTGSSTQFWDDIATIDWVGVNIARELDTAEQIYGLDNWEYYSIVPEPGTMCALGSAFLSLTLVFRKRLKSGSKDSDIGKA